MPMESASLSYVNALGEIGEVIAIWNSSDCDYVSESVKSHGAQSHVVEAIARHDERFHLSHEQMCHWRMQYLLNPLYTREGQVINGYQR